MKEIKAGRPWAGGSVAVDALVVWALRDQRAGDPLEGLFGIEAEAMGMTPRRSSTDGCAAVERIAAMGCQVDGGGYSSDGADPIADLVAMMAVQVGGEAARMIMEHGRAGTEPAGWNVPAHWLVPERWEADGDLAMTTYVNGKQGQHCPLMRVNSPEGVEAARERYLMWWDGLELLGFHLSTRALGFVVQQPGVPRTPWEVGA
ncbi:hypothetical protein [Sandarakinorhabdus sp.]|uniref:hypothetical protein n=1 Tax=Sandarakinorhabdus sp. TaxID=1916663 RepID=UPI00286E3B0D|nr:hypothetical protein [Sandarakinorhabdus sp.]